MKNFIKGLFFSGVMLALMMCFSHKADAKDANGNVIIVIDAGHGGEDSGAQATTGAFESHCNFAIASAMKDELMKYDGVKVYLTREEDSWMTNTGRAMIAADLKADFLISVHNNSGSETNTGALAFRSLNSYYSEATNDMCTRILDNLATLGLNNGGVQTRTSTSYDFEDYYTLIGEGVRAGVPSIIVEHCFLSNPNDAALVSNPDGTLKYDFLTKMGEADANAVVSYFKLSKKTAIADNNTTVELEKGYSVSVSTIEQDSASWFSTNQNVATVDSDGNVKAVGSGTTNIVYQLVDGTEGSCTVIVNPAKEVSLTGGIDPTFYQVPDEFKKIDKSSVFAYVIYSDGTAKKVVPESVADIDTSKVGIQDVEIKYAGMTGKLRVCHNSSEYTPVVTLPAKEESTEASTEAVTESKTEAVTGDSKTEEGNKEKSLIRDIAVYLIVLVVLIAIGVVIVLLEIKKKKRRRRNRSRKYL